MKRILLLLALISMALWLSGQTTLLDPNGDGGFETGPTLTANGWTLGGASLNTWYTGTAPAGYTGQRCGYVATVAGGGSNWTYVNSSGYASIWLYRDIAFPAGETDIRLSFDYRSGQSLYDGVRLLVAPTTWSVSISDYTYALATTLNKSGAWTHASFKIDPSYAGTTKRVYFLWISTTQSPVNPPFAFDNVRITSRVPASLSGTYTIDNSQAESGGNFRWFGDAVMALNSGGISGPVTFNVAPGQTLIECFPSITQSGSQTNPIVFQKDPNVSGTNPKLRSPGVDTSYLTVRQNAVFTLIGTDWYTFDGIDLEDNRYLGETDQILYGVQLLNDGGANGCQNITVKNCSISMNGQSAVIQQNLVSGVTSANGAHSYNVFQNLNISGITGGVYIKSPSSVYPDLDCVVRDCVLGGTSSNTLYGFGVYVNNGHGVSIYNNIIRNLTVHTSIQGGTVDYPAGISVMNWGNVGNRIVSIYNNKISNLTTTIASLNAINVHQRGTGEVRVYNNTILGLRNDNGSDASYARGIYLQDYSSSGGSVTFNVDFNTIIMDSDNFYSMNWEGINLGQFSSSGDVYKVRNNIIAFYGTWRLRIALNGESSISAINPASVIDRNIYYSALRGNDFRIWVSYYTLGAWIAATGFDANSRMEDPKVVAYNDPHIRTDVATPVEDNGSFFGDSIPWALYDIDGSRTLRDPSTPDIGAYEGNYVYYPHPGTPSAPTYTYPGNAAANIPTSGWNYQWTASTGSPIGYMMSIGTNNPPSNLQNSYDLGNVLQYNYYSHQANTTHYWKVVAYNDYGASTSPVWSFTTVNPYPDPSIPVYPPLNDTTIPVSGWNFSWLPPVNTGGSAIQQYMFALYEGWSFTPVISMQMLPSTTLSYPMNLLLKYNTNYRWTATPLNGSWNQPQSGNDFFFTTTTIYQNSLPVDNGQPDPPDPEVQIPNLTGLYDFSSWALWEPAGIDVEHSGLAIYVRGNFQNRVIEIDPDLGYVPDRIVYRIVGSGGWLQMEAQPDWTPGYVYLMGPSGGKDAGDLEIVFQGGDETLPVVLASFSATPTAQNNAVTLSWTTHSETNLNGYYIFRNTTPELATALNLNFLVPAANSSSSHSYNFVDSEIYADGTYYYWLNSLDLDGSSLFFGPISITLVQDDPNPPQIPLQTLLTNVYPNPFNPATTISYSLTEPGMARIDIFNQRGQNVYHHTQNHSAAGYYNHLWNAPELASGVYYLVFTAGKYRATRKVMLMK